MLRNLKTVVLSSCVAALALSCRGSDSGNDPGDDGLVIISKDPNTAIEAKYHEGAHSITLRSKPEGSDILDEQGRSMTDVASTIVQGGPSRVPGAAPLPLPALIENGARLERTLKLSNHGLRQLRDAIGSAGGDSKLFRQLSQQTTILHKALIQTRLQLLQQWGNEAARHITMSSDEHAKFFAILNRAATAIAGTAKGQADTRPSVAIKTLLGPQRYGMYEALEKTFFTADLNIGEVLP